MTTPAIKGPGLLYVNSKISNPLLNEATFMNWYSTDHIPEIMATSSINSALRFKNADAKAEKPNLVLYPMKDIGFTQGEEFRRIRVHSEILPGGLPIYDLADVDVRYYGLEEVYDPRGNGSGPTKLILTAGMELGSKVTDQDFNDWYQKEHMEELSKVPNYVRTTRYKLLYHRTNAQSRVLKGLPPREEDKEVQTPPKYLAIHEFDTESPDFEEIMKTAGTEWSKRILENVERMEIPNFRLVERYGDGEFFHQ